MKNEGGNFFIFKKKATPKQKTSIGIGQITFYKNNDFLLIIS
jgi:hypothetical protein